MGMLGSEVMVGWKGIVWVEKAVAVLKEWQLLYGPLVVVTRLSL